MPKRSKVHEGLITRMQQDSLELKDPAAEIISRSLASENILRAFRNRITIQDDA